MRPRIVLATSAAFVFPALRCCWVGCWAPAAGCAAVAATSLWFHAGGGPAARAVDLFVAHALGAWFVSAALWRGSRAVPASALLALLGSSLVPCSRAAPLAHALLVHVPALVGTAAYCRLCRGD